MGFFLAATELKERIMVTIIFRLQLKERIMVRATSWS